MTSVPPPPAGDAGPRPRRAPDWRRLWIVAAIGVVLAVGAVGIARMLDDPVGGSSRDEAQPAVGGNVAGLTTPSQTSTSGATASNGGLPPFAMVLERPLPGNLSEVSAEQAVQGLEARVQGNRAPRRLVELAVGYQRLNRPDKAKALFTEALRAQPGYVLARIGLATIPGQKGLGGLDRTQEELAKLRRAYPRSQVIAFNQGWTAVYRRDARVAFASLENAQKLAPNSYLGVVAGQLLAAANEPQSTTGP